MFAGSTCVEVAVAVAESCEEDEVGVGAVMVTVGSRARVAGGVVRIGVDDRRAAAAVVGSRVDFDGYARRLRLCYWGGPSSYTRRLGLESVFPAVPVPELPPACVPPDCPLTYEADGLVFESVGDWPSGEAVVAVEPSPFCTGFARGCGARWRVGDRNRFA